MAGRSTKSKPAKAKRPKKAHKPGNKGQRGGAQPGAGRNAWQPNDAQRAWVVSAAQVGTPEKDMAAVLGISNNTLRKACAHELDLAETMANVEVGGALYRKAVGKAKVIKILDDGTEEIIEEAVPSDTTAAIWWTKTRMGWKEVTKHEHGGDPDAPIEHIHRIVVYPGDRDGGRLRAPVAAEPLQGRVRRAGFGQVTLLRGDDG